MTMTFDEWSNELREISSESNPTVQEMRLHLLNLREHRGTINSDVLTCLNVEMSIQQGIALHRIAASLDVLAQPSRDEQQQKRAFNDGLSAMMESAKAGTNHTK